MDYEGALGYLYGLRVLGKKAGLSGIIRLMQLLGDPQSSLRFIHIAGTNGKGSTTVMLSNILKHTGYKTGIFISPYITDFRERIQINGEMISKSVFTQIVETVKEQVDIMSAQNEYPTFFEVVTAIALCYFSRECCDVVCLEVGLGGRFDATNVIERALVSVITSVSLDHMELLGNTVESIAFEKCGILKDGGVCVSYPLQEESVLKVIEEQCVLKHNRLIVADISQIHWEESGYCTKLVYKGMHINLPLPGRYQVANAATVFCVIEELRLQGMDIPDTAIVDGMNTVKFPARLELVSREPDVIIDGAHNIAGIRALGEYVDSHPAVRKVLLFGVLRDKEYKRIISEIAPKADAIVATTPKIDRALPSRDVCEVAKAYCANVVCEDDFESAVDIAKAFAGKDGAVFVCGSLYLASDVRKILL